MRRKRFFLRTALLTRQFLNWWLGYILSQPIDIDLSVFGYFIRSFIRISFVGNNFVRLRHFITEKLDTGESNAVEEIVA